MTSIASTLRRRRAASRSPCCSSAVMMLINVVLRGARVDLTQSQLYTIAPGTQNIVSSLKEPINLYFFFSDKRRRSSLPQLRAYAQRVRELLRGDGAALAAARSSCSVIDPQPFSEDEDRATEFGLQCACRSARAANQLYFGLAGTNSTDGREIDPVLPAGQGAVPRVRRRQADLPARASRRSRWSA